MGLQINFPDSTDLSENAENAYLMLERKYNDVAKSGLIAINAWQNKAARDAKSQKICTVSIPIKNTSEEMDPETECVKTLAWDDVGWASGAELYGLIKTKKIMVHAQIIDMSEAVDA